MNIPLKRAFQDKSEDVARINRGISSATKKVETKTYKWLLSIICHGLNAGFSENRAMFAQQE